MEGIGEQIAAFFVGVTAALLLAYIVGDTRIEALKKEAVKAGAAHYVMDQETGRSTFEFISVKEATR